MRAKDVRKGNVILYKNVPHRVLESVHRTPGNLRAFVQMKLRNVVSGMQAENRFSSDEDIDVVDISQSKASFMYSDESGYHFMDPESFEQTTLNEELVGDTKFYLFEGIMVEISIFDERPIGITLPKTVTLEVTETSPEMKGATASNSPKPATLNTGLVVSVPPFIKIGEKVIVDTEEGVYLSRA
jgi:elongation factor P